MSNSSEICSQCGAKLPIGTIRCSYCGSSIQTTQEKSAQEPQLPLSVAEKSQIPPELMRLKRPNVQRSLEGSGCMLVFALVWTLISVPFVFIGVGGYIRDTIDYNRLTTEGLPATATITRLEIQSGEDSDTYYVHYQFRAVIRGDSTLFQGLDQVSAGYYHQLFVGQDIPIVYWASDPNLSAVKAEIKPPDILLLACFGGIGGLFTLFGLAMLFSSIKSIAHLRRLRLHGRQTQAFIFDRWTDKDSDGDTTYFIAYAFQLNLPGRGPVTVTRAEQNEYVYKRYQVGDSVPVRFLPEDPNICQLQIERK